MVREGSGRMSINEIEKQFFELFEIKKLCNRETYKLCVGGIDCDECSSPYYPRISDRKLLELLCVYNEFQNSYELLFIPTNIIELKDSLLRIMVDSVKDE